MTTSEALKIVLDLAKQGKANPGHIDKSRFYTKDSYKRAYNRIKKLAEKQEQAIEIVEDLIATEETWVSY